MGPKLLFVMGIVLAHGALAAGWMKQETPKPREGTVACVNSPGPLPYFAPQRELVARNDIRVIVEDVVQP